MNLDYEKIIDEIINRLKSNSDVSDFKKNRKTSSFLTLLSKLHSLPKNRVPNFDQLRVKNQILDRITVPVMKKQRVGWFGMLSTGQLLRVSAGILGSLIIVASLTLGTAVAALNSVPGQTIYPLKRVVENIELRLTPQSKRANLQLKFADNRIDELQQVLQAEATGEISNSDLQKIVAETVKDLQKSASAATKSSTGAQSSSNVATKLADISNQLRIASIQSEGQIKIDLEQAAADIEQTVTPEPQESPIDNNSVSATGKLTAVNKNYVSIGTAKFLLSSDTKYVNVTADTLAEDQLVSIQGIVEQNNRAYAQTITLLSDITPTETENNPENTSTDTTQEPPPAQ